ncbi:MAG: hypothetical protein A3C30_02440 [Candidatus Levybacteria bacterium RIFCSPHIGHO2_02_FULL_40_18]|nr:MAG: hypothetical protein A2869_03475 [Candidatus Levybacteria bacterium RIFCSPHIGHO2_01_FULL_40_58]OGH26562.1 MAG: hypothetical protein A3C30_02440 [Candidatus Levybacteria bacterium RIFCSPHIGHO2_02_FULL_40_18]OGH30913.1 MAG: hypothetical protein A3E43_04195 [Candidatus Levybacteria bacterium RIFCSPHIGHO2_12_FULL_40_31]OGH40924.1 MAG: hypothetical protein A2894_01410 [Candidatus Levybacteria bacterium RIFCSPLOWO2_01_FULL_40_64]OGH48610.1 MAG: hypothetical protein A3I54_02435 [Candidatus Lev
MLHSEREKVESIITGLSVPTCSFEHPLIKENWNTNNPHLDVVDRSDDRRLSSVHLQGKIQFAIPELPDKVIFCPPYVLINEEPTTHPGSNALYYSEMQKGNNIILISFLPPFKWTSPLHWHLQEEGKPPIIEYYELAYGSATIHHKESDKGVPAPEYFSFRHGVRHRMQSGREGALLSILMRDAARYPQALRHIHF